MFEQFYNVGWGFQAFVWGRRQFQKLSYESYFKLDISALMSFVPQYNMPQFLGIGLSRDLSTEPDGRAAKLRMNQERDSYHKEQVDKLCRPKVVSFSRFLPAPCLGLVQEAPGRRRVDSISIGS